MNGGPLKTAYQDLVPVGQQSKGADGVIDESLHLGDRRSSLSDRVDPHAPVSVPSIDYRLNMVGPYYLNSSSARHREHIGGLFDVPYLHLLII